MFRVAQILLATVLSSAGLSGVGTLTTSSPDAIPARAVSTVVLHDADDRWTASIDAAVERFTEVGLAAPVADVHVYADQGAPQCRGHAGLFSASGESSRVDLCIPYFDSDLGTHLRSKLLFHELAHVWDHQQLDQATRRAFMAYVGTSAWNDLDQSHYSSIERAADTIAYGLLADTDLDITQACGFEILTERVLPGGGTEHCARKTKTLPPDAQPQS